jgi:Tol biopolymer transport system component
MPADSVEHLQLSPDGQRVAASRKVGVAGSDIWLWELDRRVFTRLTFDDWTDGLPVWSPDSREVAYVSFRTDGGQIYRKDISGAGSEEKLTEGATLKVPLDWSRDGKYLLYAEREGSMNIWALPLNGDRQPLAVAVTPATESLARISPDGRWIAYGSNESGRNEVYVRPSPWLPSKPSGKWLVSTSGGNDPDWSVDGRQIYYEAADGAIMAATVRDLSQGFRTDTPRVIVIAGHDARGDHSFDVTSDGSRFLVAMPGEEVPAVPFVVLSNWQARLR